MPTSVPVSFLPEIPFWFLQHPPSELSVCLWYWYPTYISTIVLAALFYQHMSVIVSLPNCELLEGKALILFNFTVSHGTCLYKVCLLILMF